MHIENVDLNLLKALSLLLEERHVSRAAVRGHLSQSAMSRSLSRLRGTIGDELLVRAGSGYELTPRARAIQAELELILPRLQAIVNGAEFDPRTAIDIIRLHCTDYASTVLGPILFRELFTQAPRMSMTMEALSPHTFDDVDRGRADLALTPVKPQAPLRWRTLFDESFVCILAADHPLTSDQLSLEDLAEYPHASVVALPLESMLVERRMLEFGMRPPSGLRVPYFSAAVAALPGTTLIATLPRRMALLHADDPNVRIANAPEQFTRFEYGMVWHPRLERDPVNAWVRSLVIAAGEAVAAPV